MKRLDSDRLISLLDTLGELFPQGEIVLDPAVSLQDEGWRLVPSKANPRLAVPSNVPKAAMLSSIRPCASDRLKHTARRYMLAMLLRTPLAARLMPAGITGFKNSGSISEYLQCVFAQPVCFGLMTGSARANRKPVLGIFDLAGNELGFAKVGLSKLASGLVSNEHDALLAMSQLDGKNIQVPEVISYGLWENNPVLVMSALRPDALQKQLPPPVEAIRSVIASAPVITSTVLESSWYYTVVQKLDQLPDLPEAKHLSNLLTLLAQKCSDKQFAFGAWHGDFGAWNMARTSGAPMIWDWERYSQHIPLGLDLYHFQAHDELRKTGNMLAAVRAMNQLETAEIVCSLHREYGCTNSSQETQQIVPLLYLATLATRFLEDGHRHETSSTLELGRWHTEVIQELLQNTNWR